MSDHTSTLPPPVEEARQQVSDHASEQARNIADQARSQVDERSTQYGRKATEHAGDLRSVAEHLRAEGKDQPAKLAEQAAEKVERAGSWLTESDADKILREVEDFGRKRPWAVIGAGIAIGVAASRMLKASSTHRYESTAAQLPSGTGLQDTTQRTSEGTWAGKGTA